MTLLDDLKRLASETYVSPYLVAVVHLAADDADAGFRLLRQAVSERLRDVLFIRVSRSLQEYRDDPRYPRRVAEIGFLE